LDVLFGKAAAESVRRARAVGMATAAEQQRQHSPGSDFAARPHRPLLIHALTEIRKFLTGRRSAARVHRRRSARRRHGCWLGRRRSDRRERAGSTRGSGGGGIAEGGTHRAALAVALATL